MEISKSVGASILVVPPSGFDAEVEVVSELRGGEFHKLLEIQQGKSTVKLDAATIAVILRWARGDESYSQTARQEAA